MNEMTEPTEAERLLASSVETIASLRAELAQAQTECNVLARTFTDANELHAIVRGELAQLRRELAVPTQRCGYCGYRYSAGTDAVNFAVMAEHIKSCPRHPLAKALAELAQARTEALARLDKIERLGRDFHDERDRRDEWKRMCDLAIADTAIADTKVKRLQECLEIARQALEYIKGALPGTMEMAISALDEIEQCLAQLEPEEEAG